MSKRKGSASLNVYIGLGVMFGLEEYCRLTGRTKTIVTERALREYLEAHRDEIESIKPKGGAAYGR